MSRSASPTSGHGIEPHLIDRVFDPFFTTKPKGEGTGLGLSTVYGIVKQSGGYIYAENRAEGGAQLHHPAAARLAAQKSEMVRPAAEAPVPPAPDLTGQGAVMLVEDEAPVRSFASRALEAARLSASIEAESAEDAMALLSKGNESIDVLVSDVVMPGMDGPTFAGKARQLRPNLRVIFISGYAEESFRRNLVEFGLPVPAQAVLAERSDRQGEAGDGRARQRQCMMSRRPSVDASCRCDPIFPKLPIVAT